ncbi:CRAL-TRIO domain-containing protein [Obelidium mucronatum]|nr:CRAL-TRIO domain-containing protein [Obelidium mucronatum]
MTGTPILKPSTQYPLSPPSLSLEELELVESLNQLIPGLIGSLSDGSITPQESETLLDWSKKSNAAKRYLVDCKWDLAAATKKLGATLEWRRSYKPEEITLEEVEVEAKTGKGFISGFDKQGRPILFIIPRLDTAENPERALRFLVMLIERLIGLMPAGVEKMAVVVDFEGVGFFNATPMSVAIKYLHVLQNHFPERLGVLVVMNPTLFLSGLFSVLKPLMDPVTVAKIHLLSPTGSATDSFDLQSIFSADQLPVAYGGTHEFSYDHNEYWSVMGNNSLEI